MTTKSVSLNATTDYSAEAERIARGRKYAEMLQQESIQGAPAGQMAGNTFVGTSPLTHLAKALQGVNARGLHSQADADAKALGAQKRADTGADMQTLISALQGTKAQQASLQEDVAGNAWMGDAVAAKTPVESLQSALPMMRTPEGQQLGFSYLSEQLKPKELFSKIDPKDYTPESVAAYAQTKNPAVLVAVRKNEVVNLGGTSQVIDPWSAKPGTQLTHTQSPDALANLEFRKFEFNNLSANQQAQLKNELTRIGISQEQLRDGKVQLVQDADGQVMLVNKMTGFGQQARDADGKPLQGNVKPTESQAKAAVFASQMKSASEALGKIPGYDPNSGVTQADTAVAGGRGNMIASQSAQMAKQAQSQWAEAFLRFKTGAASTPAEVALNVATFFPQVGDKPGVIEQKAQMRAQAERDLGIAAGRAGQSIIKTPAAPEADPLGLRVAQR